MFIACWSLKGGSGTTVVAAALGLLAAGSAGEGAGSAGEGAVLVDLAGDLPAVIGRPEPQGAGVAEWLRAGADVPPDGWARLEATVGPSLALVTRGQGPMPAGDRAEVLAGMLAAEPRAVVVDCGTIGAGPVAANQVLAAFATVSLLVIRPCYLALRHATRSPLVPSGIVLLDEPGRALGAHDVEQIVGAPVIARVAYDPAVARAVDAGLLATRLPRGLERALRHAA